MSRTARVVASQEKRRNAVSGHSVSAVHEKVLSHEPAPEVVAENASDAIRSPRSPRRTSLADPAGNDWDATRPAPNPDATTPRAPARPLGSTDSRSSDMTSSDGRSDSEAAAGAVLLATKLHVPSIGAQLVHRAALLDALSAGCHRKLTLLSAPAGWGKTTLLAQWALGADEDQQFGWLSLDASDNDPVWFWMYVVAALQKTNPEVGIRAVVLLAMGAGSVQ